MRKCSIYTSVLLVQLLPQETVLKSQTGAEYVAENMPKVPIRGQSMCGVTIL